ncbi:MAG: ABC transporter ATP-binding protein [Nostocoides sp.]
MARAQKSSTGSFPGGAERPDIKVQSTAGMRAVSHRYGSQLALDDVTVSLSEGVTALVGVNGAGKSTLLRILSGALRPTSGQVRLGDADPYLRGERHRALRRVALMPQLAEFPPHLSVQEVVSCVAWLKGADASTAADLAAAAVHAVGLGERATSHLRTLSGGMVRRVALAQAIASRPDVLLLDEPSTGLDPAQRRAMIDLIGGLRGTVLFSSHVIEDVESLAHRVVVLNAGRVVFDGPIHALRARGAEDGRSPASHSALERAFLALISAPPVS